MLIPNIRSQQDTPTNSVGEFVKWWNINFPLDRWYRTKYNIRWGSEEHRNTTLLSIHFEYEEERIFNHLKQEVEEDKKRAKYTPGDWFNSSGEEIDDDIYDQIDISKIGDGEVDIET